jgi:thiol-disulfide isomerase/thioredoxin
MMQAKVIISGFVSLMLALQIFGQSNSNRYSVSGFIKGLQKDTVVYLILNESKSGDTLAQTVTQSGNFSLQGKLKSSIEFASVRVKGLNVWPTFLLENKEINISGAIEKWQSAKILGSVATDFQLIFVTKMQKLKEIYGNSEMGIVKALSTGNNTQLVKQKALEKRTLDLMINTQDNFIKEHPNEAFTAWLIQDNPKYDLKRKEQEYAKLGHAAKESSFGMRLYQHIQEQKLTRTITPGSISPDFKIQTVDGQIISLKELLPKHNLILVDFWASWCVPCRNLTPELRKIQNAFQVKGFTILSISRDENKNAWKAAIKKDSMDWLQGTIVKGELDPSQIFGGGAVPTLVLLDSQGRILALDGAPSFGIPSFGFYKSHKPYDTDVIYDKIAELLKNKN